MKRPEIGLGNDQVTKKFYTYKCINVQHSTDTEYSKHPKHSCVPRAVRSEGHTDLTYASFSVSWAFPIVRQGLTCAPYILSSCITKTDEIDVTIPPVTMEMITRPIMIQTMANTRPGMVTGLRSPYLRNDDEIYGN
jgi:hypothetical protein